jgi:hypothetical protein
MSTGPATYLSPEKLILGPGDDSIPVDTCYVCGEKFKAGDPVLVVIEGRFGVMQIGEKIVSHMKCVSKEMDKLICKK